MLKRFRISHRRPRHKDIRFWSAIFLSPSLILDVDYRLCITWIIHQQLWGYKVEGKLCLGVHKQKRLNTTVLQHHILKRQIPVADCNYFTIPTFCNSFVTYEFACANAPFHSQFLISHQNGVSIVWYYCEWTNLYFSKETKHHVKELHCLVTLFIESFYFTKRITYQCVIYGRLHSSCIGQWFPNWSIEP
jgi:hypothetical protein